MIGAGEITGLVLAGGLGRRMSADGRGLNKSLATLRGVPLIDHVLGRLRPQVGTLLINANVGAECFAPRSWPVIADRHPGHAGPLAGLHAGLCAARTPWVLTVPCDSPFIAPDLARRLALAVEENPQARLAVASVEGREQPVFALVSRGLAADLDAWLREGGRKIDLWYGRLPYVRVEFPDPQAFINLNTTGDIERHGGP